MNQASTSLVPQQKGEKMSAPDSEDKDPPPIPPIPVDGEQNTGEILPVEQEKIPLSSRVGMKQDRIEIFQASRETNNAHS